MRRVLVSLLVGAAVASPAQAWTRPAHMVSAAIAWSEIEQRRPELLDRLGELLEAHPDRGPFEVAVDRTTGREKARRMFMQCARWPDDVRRTAQDQPSWHLALKPVRRTGAGVATATDEPVFGAGLEATAMNLKVLGEAKAEAAERARALCWVLHVAADLHQPLHSAQLFSVDYPEGDRAGGAQFVRDPLSGDAISLHWLWDDAVHRSGLVADVDARAKELMRKHPRATLKGAAATARPQDVATWVWKETYPLAVSLAYGRLPATSKTADGAKAPPADYWSEVQRVSEERLTLSGYRLADLVIGALDAPA
jgi:hypothetical protein